MSYSIRLIKEDKEEDVADITWNLARMFEALPVGNISDWDGQEVIKLAEPVRESLNLLLTNPDEYKQYESSNGWGTVGGAITFLKECLIQLIVYPDYTVKIE